MIKRLLRRHPKKTVLFVLILLYIVWVFIAALPFLRFKLHPWALIGGEKNYLVLFQNNYELRPTGGFISAFGILTIKNGIPASFNFEDVYGSVDDHSYVAPPKPLGQLLAHSTYAGHTFRDANFNPDFPSSVSDITKFLQKTRPFQKVDGFFALDLVFLENWLDAVSNVTVNGEVIDSDHLLEQIENIVANLDLHDLEARAQRKGGVKQIAKALALKTVLPWNIPKFLNAVKKSFDEKHALLYFSDEALQKIVTEKNWAGEIAPNPGEDFLGIVDANYGGGKANRYVTRSVFYSLDLERGSSSLDVRYDHSGELALPLSAPYRGYLRVYLPENHSVGRRSSLGEMPVSSGFGLSNNASSDATFQDAEYSGKEAMTFFAGKTFEVPIRSSKTLHFDFEYPKSVLDTLTYRLNIRKQPGTDADMYTVSVRVPTGMRVKSSDFEMTENIATFRGSLDRDRTISFELEKDPYAPRVISQKLSRLNELEIFWNEPISPVSLRPELWTVKDLNIQNEANDTLLIESFMHTGTKLVIKTRGMTLQPEERYLLEISGVSDFHGNSIPKRTYTFFQRLE